ncbi:hypothetical protein Patl1_28673 [Pistacia atlantica]|uniref:Uncharacterized protein n=1 Tax=Pistacia atlantica TaxID=434234 RepID=A0ACC1BG69_9ROSI|nr:hypothetical protein Patl1_28673 [Pistacia atlantica]
MTNSTTSFFINYNGAGAEFVHAFISNYEGISKPLLTVQITELVNGIFIGFTVNHVMADGTSFWHFFNSWSEMSRALRFKIYGNDFGWGKPIAVKNCYDFFNCLADMAFP